MVDAFKKGVQKLCNTEPLKFKDILYSLLQLYETYKVSICYTWKILEY